MKEGEMSKVSTLSEAEGVHVTGPETVEVESPVETDTVLVGSGSDKAMAKSGKRGVDKTSMDRVGLAYVKAIEPNLTKNYSDLNSDVLDVIRTISIINTLGPYDRFVKIGHELYEVGLYEVEDMFKGLVGPSKVTVCDDSLYCVDLLNRSFYNMTLGKGLDPASFKLKQLSLVRALRLNPHFDVVLRTDVILANASGSAVSGGKVHDVGQATWYPLTYTGYLKEYYNTDLVTLWVPNAVIDRIGK